MDYKEFIKVVEEKYCLFDDSDEIKKYWFDDYPNLCIEVSNENGTFDIFVEFTHPLYITEEYEHESEVEIYYAKYFEKILKERFLAEPEESSFNYVGAPFDDQRLGYFQIPYEVDFVETFVSVYEKWNITINEVESYGLVGEEVWDNLLLSKWKTFKNEIVNKGYIDRGYYVKRHDSNVVMTSLYFEEKFNKEFNIDINYINSIEKQHYGRKYVLLKLIDDKMLAIRRALYDEVINCIQGVEETFDIKLYTDSKKIIYIKVESIIAIIPLSENLDYIRTLEYNYLSEAFGTFNDFAPPEMVKNISFENLDDELFEKLCFEFLACEGYFDIHPLGKTRASDGGCDLFAKKRDNEFWSDRREEKWIIQCKYSKSTKKKSFKREMFSEIPDLLEENYSDKYLLLTTADLTPAGVYRIYSINKRKNNIIEFLAVNELKLALCKYPKLVYKYNLVIERKIKPLIEF